MNDKVVDKYDLLQHLPKHQKKFIIKHHPDYLQKLTNEYESKIQIAMNTPPGVYQKFNEIQVRRDYELRLKHLLNIKKEDKGND